MREGPVTTGGAFIVASACVLLLACGGAGTGDDAGASSPLGAWKRAHALPVARFEGDAVTARGKVWFLGGITGKLGDQSSARESDSVEVYDPSTDTWSSGPKLPAGSARHHLALAVIDDRIYLVGGFTGIIGGADVAGRFLPNAQTWVLDHDAWRRLADQPLARGAATAQVLAGKIYVVGGGSDEKGAFTDLLVYDPATDRWSDPKAPMPTEREHVASCALDGKMIVAGGWSGEAKAVTGAVESYDPATNAWSKLAALPTARGGMAAAVIDRRCYVVGGERWDLGAPGTFDVVEAYDATTRTWSKLAPLPIARHGVGVTTLGAALYVVGGGPIMGNSYTDDVEVFTP